MYNDAERKGIACGAVVVGGAVGYLLSDRRNFLRSDADPGNEAPAMLQPDEKEILSLASLIPVSRSGCQPSYPGGELFVSPADAGF